MTVNTGKTNMFSKKSEQATTRGGPKETVAFINIDLPSKSTDSGFKRLGSLRLYADNPDHVALAEFMNYGPENVAKVMNKIRIDFRVNTPSDGTAFDLED